MKKINKRIAGILGIIFCLLIVIMIPAKNCHAAKKSYQNKYQKTIFNTTVFFDYNKYQPQAKKYKTNVIIEWNDANYSNVKKWLINNGIKASKAKSIRKVRFQIKIKGKWIKSKYFVIHLNEKTVGFSMDGQFLLKQRLTHDTVYPLKAEFVNSKNKVLYTQKFYSFVPTAIKYNSLSVEKVGTNALKISWPRSKMVKGYEIYDSSFKKITTFNNYYTFYPNSFNSVNGENVYRIEIKAFSKYGPDNPTSTGESLLFYVDLNQGKVLTEQEYYGQN